MYIREQCCNGPYLLRCKIWILTFESLGGFGDLGSVVCSDNSENMIGSRCLFMVKAPFHLHFHLWLHMYTYSPYSILQLSCLFKQNVLSTIQPSCDSCLLTNLTNNLFRMVKLPNRSTSQGVKPYGYGNGHAHGFVAGMQIIQYRSYQRDILIYHVRRHLLSLSLIYKALQGQKEYHDKLTSFDPIRHYPIVEGDGIPEGCIEAAYMPSILHGHGSALALRSSKEAGRVEWFVFSGPIHDSFLSQIMFFGDKWNLQPDLDPDDPRKVFNLVGYAEKGLTTRRVKGANAEHKGWHDSLCTAKEEKKSLKLTWKGYVSDLQADQERRRRAEVVRDTDEELEGEDNLLGGVDASRPPQPPQKSFARRKA